MSFGIVASVIYGLGLIFYVCLAFHIWAREFADRPSLKNVLWFPVYILIGIIFGLAWPIMLFVDDGFREGVVECGRLMIPLGYLGSTLMTFIYPWIWAWYIGCFIFWIFLERYQNRLPMQTQK